MVGWVEDKHLVTKLLSRYSIYIYIDDLPSIRYTYGVGENPMTSLERKFEKIVEQLHKRYSFLEGVSIDVNEGYGLDVATCYRLESQSINIDLKALRKSHQTERYVLRFGAQKTFADFVLVILLHEICHAKQFQTISEHRLLASIREIQPYDEASHDECWVEQEADTWARQELRKWNRNRSTRTPRN